jgi:hypothetical protein
MFAIRASLFVDREPFLLSQFDFLICRFAP